jgi:ABC-type Na+ transport system ATPase subunit NatA/multidrug resistance efflux pump
VRARYEEAQAALATAAARVEAARTNLAVMRKEVPVAIEIAEAGVASAEAAERRALGAEAQDQRDAERARRLVADGSMPEQSAEQAQLVWQLAQDQRVAAQASRTQAQRSLDDARLGPHRIRAKEAELMSLEAMRREAEARVAEAQTAVDDLRIASAIDAVVTSRFANVGEVVNAGMPLMELVDLDRLYLKVYVPEREIGKVRRGLPARIYSDAFPGKPFDATVRYIASRAEFTPKEVQTPDERTKLVYEVRLYLDANPDHKLTPGLPADAVIRWNENVAWARRVVDDAVVRVRGLCKHYRKRTAVDGIDLDVRRGELYGLIGPDGAGKSSLMKAVAGVLVHDAGTVDVFGVTLNSERTAEQVKGRLGFMPQGLGLNLYPELSVEENIDYFAQLRLVPKLELAKRKSALLAMTRLARFADRPMKNLSGGMKQKLGLVCTLIHEPELVILDEPTTGVDPISRRDFWTILGTLLRERCITALVSTAYLDEATQFDRLAPPSMAGMCLRRARRRSFWRWCRRKPSRRGRASRSWSACSSRCSSAAASGPFMTRGPATIRSSRRSITTASPLRRAGSHATLVPSARWMP